MNIKDMVTLSDNIKYVVVSKVIYENQAYYYLIENNNFSNIKFMLERGKELVLIKDSNLIKKLLPMFISETEKSITLEEIELLSFYNEENQ